MANTLTNLIPTIYKALDVVSNEPCALIDSVSRDASLEEAAKDQTIRSFVAPASSTTSITPAATIPDTGDQTIGSKTMTISKSKRVDIRWNGEEQLSVTSGGGPGYYRMLSDQFAQAYRALRNEVEADIASLYYKASNASTPAGTTLFDATTQLAFRDIANSRKLLLDNGAPVESGVFMVLNTTAGAAIRGNSVYNSTDYQVDVSQRGIILDRHGVLVKESAQIKSATAGTNSGGRTDAAGYAIGATTLTLDSNGTGSILQGDVITITGDASGAKYVVTSGDADVSGGGTITIAAPGLKGTLSAATHAITVDASTDKNMVFTKNAIHLATRVPKAPVEGDLAVDSMVVQDPRTGLAFSIRMYPGYYNMQYQVGLAWGYEVIKPEHLVLLVD
jgi:hypothetical protein